MVKKFIIANLIWGKFWRIYFSG